MVHRKRMFPEHIPASDNTLIYYPYARARQLLDELAANAAGSPESGVLVDYVNPSTNGPTFPSMGTAIRLIAGKTSLEAMHRTENVIYITMEGSATFHLPDGKTFTTEAHDVTAIPSWVPYSISNAEDEPVVLFSQTDRPVFEALGFYREQRA